MAGQDDHKTCPEDLAPVHGNIDGLSEVTMKMSLPRERRLRRVVLPTVRVVAGPDLLHFASLAPETSLILGRDEAAGLSLTDASVSRNHVRVLACLISAPLQVQVRRQVQIPIPTRPLPRVRCNL